MGTQIWDVSSQQGFMSCYRAPLPEVFRYTAMLCGSDRSSAEDVVQDVYLAALSSARDGRVSELSWIIQSGRAAPSCRSVAFG